MMTMEGMKFLMLIALPISIFSFFICGCIYSKFAEKKPILSLVICGIIIVVTLYVIFSFRMYAADIGWLPIPSDEITNLTMGLA